MMTAPLSANSPLNAGDITRLKRQAAEAAVEFVEPGMVVGLGHGSTAIWAVMRLAHLWKQGLLPEIVCVACSTQVEREAMALGLPLASLDDHPRVDITIDGADEVDSHLNLIKGGGGAMLREKIVAQASVREIIVVDHKKLSTQLGTRFALPVEVAWFGAKATAAWLGTLGCDAKIRVRHSTGMPFETDQGNLVVDCHFGPIADPHGLARVLEARAGVVAHGLFLGLATDLVVASPDGIRHLRAAPWEPQPHPVPPETQQAS